MIKLEIILLLLLFHATTAFKSKLEPNDVYIFAIILNLSMLLFPCNVGYICSAHDITGVPQNEVEKYVPRKPQKQFIFQTYIFCGISF